ncbi:MAG: HAMP domain-containing protein [Treponema sp.]|nr:HAMP domain-containing protein [Treponema sp.]
MTKKQIKSRFFFPIGAKLVIIISILLLASLGAVISMVSALSTQEAQRTAEENNFIINIRAGSQAQSSFAAVREAVLFYMEMLERLPALGQDPGIESFFFNNNQNIAAIGVMGREDPFFIHNDQFLALNNIPAASVEAYFASPHTATRGSMRFYNAAPVFQTSLLTTVFIRPGAAGDETVKVLFSPYDLFESFGMGANTSFFINNYGSLLLHPDIFLVLGGANFSSLPIVEIMQREGDNNRQVSYEHEGARYFGAYYRLAGTNAAVITVIPHDIVFEAVMGIRRQNIFLTAAVLFVAVGFIWIFSKTISRPVRLLAAAALKIEEGDFTVDMEPQSRDELGLLTESFDKMSSALNIFGRFTSKDIALRAMRGEIKPGGLPKHATIFFSDIRTFTETTERFTNIFGDEAPNRVVQWLNEYFSRMIGCVKETGGIVDKFIGDALMAHWGTVSTAGSPAEDAFFSIKAALMMRNAVIDLNAQRPKNDPGNPAIRIGCGINTGVVIAGQIGSEDKMQYTTIGDPVNLASRVEKLNKIFETDILITEDTWRLVRDKFIVEEMPEVTVRGKEKPVRVFAVINFKDSTRSPQTMMQLREILGINAFKANKPAAAGDAYQVSGFRQEHKPERAHAIGTTPASPANAPMIKMTSFGSSARIQGPAGTRVPVFFSWNLSNFAPDTHVCIEVAEDQDFNSIVEDRELAGTLSVSIPLQAGTYWWRAYPARAGSREPVVQSYPSGTLVVDTDAKERIKIYKD